MPYSKTECTPSNWLIRSRSVHRVVYDQANPLHRSTRCIAIKHNRRQSIESIGVWLIKRAPRRDRSSNSRLLSNRSPNSLSCCINGTRLYSINRVIFRFVYYRCRLSLPKESRTQERGFPKIMLHLRRWTSRRKIDDRSSKDLRLVRLLRFSISINRVPRRWLARSDFGTSKFSLVNGPLEARIIYKTLSVPWKMTLRGFSCLYRTSLDLKEIRNKFHSFSFSRDSNGLSLEGFVVRKGLKSRKVW